MNAAVVRSTYKKADLDKVTKQYRDTVVPAVAKHAGGRSATLLVDSQTGDAISIAFYDDAAAAAAFAPKSQELIASFKQYRTSAEPKREIFEVAAATQQETKAVVERLIKAINAHDLEATARESAPDSVLLAPGDTTVKGPQAIKEYNKNWISAFPDAKIDVKSIFGTGKQVAIDAVFSGTHNGPLKTPMGDIPATGRKVSGPFLEVFEIDRGLIKNAHLMFDQVHLMTQLGLATALPQQATASAQRSK